MEVKSTLTQLASRIPRTLTAVQNASSRTADTIGWRVKKDL